MELKGFSLSVLAAAAVLSGCAHGHYVFEDKPAVEALQDKKLAAKPAKTDFDFVEYAVTASGRYPVTNALDPRRNPRSGDVNAADQLPESSWYTRRLGFKDLGPQDLVKGPEKTGAPQNPLTVVDSKRGGNTPGFIVKDARGKKYLIKFDSSEHPGLESMMNFVANRLFWAFGYNVPEDYIHTFTYADLKADTAKGVSQEDVDGTLAFASPDEQGRYTVTASLFIEGEILGAIPPRGTRKGDPNDRIPHEHMRILRALKVFCALTNNSGIRPDNTLDAFADGRTMHYMIDFGESMGAHGLGKSRRWDSFEHFFSMEDSFLRYFTLGLPRVWESLPKDKKDPKTYFEAERFDLDRWKESTQFEPIRRSRPEDDYWAAKIISTLTRGHLEALFEASNYPDKKYTAYLVDTLLARREKIVKTAFARVTPIEAEGISNGKLKLVDLGENLWPGAKTEYHVRYFNRRNRKAGKGISAAAKDGKLEVPVASELETAKGYLRVEVSVSRDGKKVAPPAEFHVRSSGGAPKLAGVVH